MQKTTSIAVRLFVLCAGLFAYSTVLAKGEHPHSRWMHYLLGDTSQIGYKIGAIQIKHEGAEKPLTFQMASKKPSAFLQTAPFTITAASDSIYFCRVVTIDDRGRNHNRYTDSTLPTSLSFDEFSTISYAVELRSAASKGVVATIDTVCIYRNGEGTMRWFGIPSTKSEICYAVPKSLVGKPLIITIRSTVRLPFWSKIVKTETDDLPNANPCDNDSHSLGAEDSPPQPIVAPAPINPASPFIYIFPNPSAGRSNVQIQCKTSGTLVLDIVSNDGEPMKRLKQQVPAGTKTIDLKFNTLPLGQYFLRIADGPSVYTFPLSLVK